MHDQWTESDLTASRPRAMVSRCASALNQARTLALPRELCR